MLGIELITSLFLDLPLEKHVGVKSVPIRSDGRSSSILPAVVGSPFKALSSSLFQYHIKRNKSLEHRVKSLVEPILIQHSNQIEKASQNLSNIQMEVSIPLYPLVKLTFDFIWWIQIQESLLHTRIVTANLLRLQMDLTQFTNRSHLQGLKRSGGT